MIFAGADGGGTKTEYVLADDSGAVLLSARLGPLSPFAGEALFRDTAASLARVFTAHGVVSARVAAAGAADSAIAAMVEQTVRDSGYGGMLSVVGDHENSLYSARRAATMKGIMPCGPNTDGGCAVLIAGTGSICFGEKAGVYRRAGGRGHVFDDGGSGYAIGRDILRAVVRADDGRGVPTVLTALVYESTGFGDIASLTTHFTDPARPKTDIAALAPLLHAALTPPRDRAVRDHAPRDPTPRDHAAEAILRRAVNDLACTAEAVIDGLGGVDALAMTGSILVNMHELAAGVACEVQKRFPGCKAFVMDANAALDAACRARELYYEAQPR